MTRKTNPELLDEDVPELGADWFSKARPASDVLPRLMGQKASGDLLKAKRGRPVLAEPKEHVNIRLDADILRAFKSRGPGWQTRVNAALREWLTSHAGEDA